MSIIRNNSIECVICTDVLSHVEDIEQTLLEIYRVLKPVIYYFVIRYIIKLNLKFQLNLEWLFCVYGTLISNETNI